MKHPMARWSIVPAVLLAGLAASGPAFAAPPQEGTDKVFVGYLYGRSIGVDFALQCEPVAERIQQSLFEQPQRAHAFRIDLERVQRRAVQREYFGMTVVTHEQLQQQLVEIEAAHEALG